MSRLLDEDKVKSTLSETSKDDEGNAVVDYQNPVYNFDSITSDIANIYRVKKPHKSFDALYIKDNSHIYLIEFKNIRRSRIPKKELHQKAYDSIMTLQMVFFPNLSLNELKTRVVLIIIYNDDDGIVEKEQDSISFDALKRKMCDLSKCQNKILFDLEIFRGILYKDVLTLEKQEYIKTMHNVIFST